MFEVLKFIIKCIGQFIAMLFTIDIGPMSLGMFMCVVFIGFPMFLFFVNFLKTSLMDEMDERYDFNKPTESWRSSERVHLNYGDGHTFTTYHDRSRQRRYQL